MVLFGETVRLLRGNRSRAELSASAGLHPSVWYRYENGSHRPRKRNFDRLLAALGTTQGEFEDLRWLVSQGARSIHHEEDPLAARRRVRFVLDGLADSLEKLRGMARDQPATRPPQKNTRDRVAPAPGRSRAYEQTHGSPDSTRPHLGRGATPRSPRDESLVG